MLDALLALLADELLGLLADELLPDDSSLDELGELLLTLPGELVSELVLMLERLDDAEDDNDELGELADEDERDEDDADDELDKSSITRIASLSPVRGPGHVPPAVVKSR